MKRSVLLLVFSVIAHLVIINTVLLIVPEIPLMEPYVVFGYNGVWLFMAFSIWYQKYTITTN